MRAQQYLLLFSVVLLCVSSNLASGNFTFQVSEVPELENLFSIQPEGWLGGDSAVSIELKENYYLWLWGDTLVGSFDYVHKKRNLTAMTHSSIAFVDPTSYYNKPIFYMPDDSNGKPHIAGVFEPQNPTRAGEYYWLVSGAMGPKSGKLFIVAMAIVDPTPTSFEQLGTDIIIVHNPMDPPQSWQYNTSRIPVTFSDLTLNSGFVYEGGYFYLLGLANMSAFWGRITEDSLENFSWGDMQFYNKDNTWSNSVWGFQSMYPSLFTEGTVQFHPFLKLWFTITLQAYDFNVYLHTAPELTGPWTTQVVYTIPPPYNNLDLYICYATKSHPEYAQDNEIVFTYNINSSQGLDPLTNEIDVYVPKFMKLTISSN